MAEPLAQDNKTQQISDLLTGQEPAGTQAPPDPSNGAGDGTPIEPVQPEVNPELTPTSVAETLGIKPSELFERLRIPVDGGDALTLEEFKGAGKDLRGVRQAQHELAENKAAFENATMLQRQQLQAAIGKIPPELLTPEMIADVQAEQKDTIATERAALLQVRPDLSESGKWAETRALLVEHLAPYGFNAIEVDGIIDHRLAKYVIDNAERAQRLKALQAEGLEPKAKEKLSGSTRQPRKPGKSEAVKQIIERGKAARSPRDKAKEVAKLLG